MISKILAALFAICTALSYMQPALLHDGNEVDDAQRHQTP
jgi:hypothetical protein